DCNGERPAPAGGRGELVTPIFHKEKVEPDAKIARLVAATLEKSVEAKNRVVGEAARPLTYHRMGDSPLGNLVTDGMRAAAKSDVSVLNAGGIRLPINQGPITYGAMFATLPFDNMIARLTLNGKELKLLLRITESGSRGFFPISGARVRLIDPAFDAPSSDL